MLQWARIVALLFGTLFLTSGLLINGIQWILYIFLRPISRYLFRKVNYYLNYSLYSQLVFVEQYWSDIQVTLKVNKEVFQKYIGKEHALLLMNHTYEIDWIIGWVLCDGCGVLGNCKTYAKKSIQYIPTMGYSLNFGDNIFLERNWNKDQNILIKRLKELICYKDPIWLLLTAEGTRYTKEKHEASRAFAQERGLPELRHHLTPRTRGFTTSIPFIRGKVPAIYNITLGVDTRGAKPTLSNILLGKTIIAEIYVERIPMKELPEKEEELAAWLHNLYKRKDDLLHSYLTTGDWFKISNVEKTDSIQMPRRIYPVLNYIFWSILILLPLCLFLFRLILSGSLAQFVTAIGIIGSFVYFLDKLIGETEISKASSYGYRTSNKESNLNGSLNKT